MKKKHLIYLSSLIIILAYQNCGQSFLDTPRDMGSSDFASTFGFEEDFKKSSPVALLSSEQVFKSMASVTRVPASDGAVNNEFNQRSGLFAANYDIKNINSPMLMGISNLASVFCNQALSKDMNTADGSRLFFNGYNFSAGASSLSDNTYQSSLGSLSLSFWGRDLKAEELKILLAGKADFLADYSAAELNNSASTKNLALYTCTAMLASYDAFTF